MEGFHGIFDSLPINFSYLVLSKDFHVDLLIKLYVWYISAAYQLLLAKEIIKFQRLVIRNGMPLIFINRDISDYFSEHPFSRVSKMFSKWNLRDLKEIIQRWSQKEKTLTVIFKSCK